MRNACIGRHLIADFWGVQSLAELSVIETVVKGAVARAGATLIDLNLHHFGVGEGVTGVALLSESHLTVHTWPEEQFAALDVFMCGDADPYVAVEHLREQLKPRRARVRCVNRGG